MGLQIKRTCRDVNDVTAVKALSCSLVRPGPEYASEMLNSSSKSSSRIASIQRRVTKLILKRDEEYPVRLRELRLLSLEDRRFIADAVFFLNHSVCLSLNSRVQFSRDVNRGLVLEPMDTPNLVTCYLITNLFKFSFMESSPS